MRQYFQHCTTAWSRMRRMHIATHIELHLKTVQEMCQVTVLYHIDVTVCIQAFLCTTIQPNNVG